MATQRKRKHAAVEELSTSRQPKSAKAQKRIDTFGSVKKPHEVDDEVKRKKTVRLCEEIATSKAAQTSKPVNRKRKLSFNSVEDDEADQRPVANSSNLSAPPVTPPRNKRWKQVLPPSPAGTPSSKATALFDKLKLDARPRSGQFVFGLYSKSSTYETPQDTPQPKPKAADPIYPAEVQQLQDLYSSFLAALSLYYAHNGTSSPVETKELLPMIAKHWKKRSVTVDDLRRILAVGQQPERPFDLEAFSKAGPCLVRRQPRGRSLKRAASYIDSDDLNARFTSALALQWTNWQSGPGAKSTSSPADFIASLPLVDIVPRNGSEKLAPLLARGRERLDDLKSSRASAADTKQQHPLPSASPLAVQPHPQSRTTALLDRILAKQSLTSSLPAGPTKTELERRAALQRVEDVARVLALLVGSGQRASFGLQTLTQQIQQSLRNPIAKEEVERCLEIMAGEIVPGFVKVVKSGDVKGVVVMKGGSVGAEELRRRVEKAGGS